MKNGIPGVSIELLNSDERVKPVKSGQLLNTRSEELHVWVRMSVSVRESTVFNVVCLSLWRLRTNGLYVCQNCTCCLRDSLLFLEIWDSQPSTNQCLWQITLTLDWDRAVILYVPYHHLHMHHLALLLSLATEPYLFLCLFDLGCSFANQQHLLVLRPHP